MDGLAHPRLDANAAPPNPDKGGRRGDAALRSPTIGSGSARFDAPAPRLPVPRGRRWKTQLDRPCHSIASTGIRFAWVLHLLLALASLVPFAAGAGNAAELNHAGVVVRDADGGLTYAYVAFPEEEIGGIELLRRTGLPLVTAGFGGLGEAVCSLAGEGCGLAECRRNVCQGGPTAPYWRYFRQAEPGDWQPLPLGASGARVRDGEIDGWSWTAGEAELPALTMPDVARLAGAAAGDLAPSDGAVPTAAVAGARATPAPAGPGDPVPYAAAAVILATIGGGALVLGRRGRDGPGPGPEAA